MLLDKNSGANTGAYRTCVVCDHSTDGLRSGEGSIAVLNDGRLLLLFSKFTGGGSDHSKAAIAAVESADEGRTWSAPKIVFAPPAGSLNCMSVSLLRLADGRLGCVFCVKHSLDHLSPMWTVSADEGATWSPPAAIAGEEQYFVVNNDRLLQCADGTLALPYALHENMGRPCANPLWDPAANAVCGLFVSLDAGKSWQRSPHTITHTPDVFQPPLVVDEGRFDAKLKYQFANRLGAFQEPGVQELPDGRLMLYMRSPWAIYRCFAAAADSPWENCAPVPGLHVCQGPQTVRRIPGTAELVMFYNDRGEVPFGDPAFGQRTPLSVAVSSDSGLAWRRIGELEPDSHNYCYFSLCFSAGRFYTTYYQSAVSGSAGGRRNLASLKFGTGSTGLLRGAG